MQLTYTCRYCKGEIRAALGQEAYCPRCDMSFETSFEVADYYRGEVEAELTGAHHPGPPRLQETEPEPAGGLWQRVMALFRRSA